MLLRKGAAAKAPEFPPAWLWFVDEAIPQWVKKAYSPRESWKDKPFSKEDAHFFFKGVEELSELFTEERSRGIPQYFNHPKFRSSYLLYFLPLQTAKFLTVFQFHSGAIDAALDHGRKQGVLRIADLGAGPGTASIAFLLNLLERGETDIPPIELLWFDTNRSILEDGKALTETLASHFPKLRGKVTLRWTTATWWDAARTLEDEISLVILGHVLNESSGPKLNANELQWQKTWQALVKKAHGGGLLIVEPAAKRPSQFISELRDRLIESGLYEANPALIWGPCPHAERCPLADGRDWCHFSVPAEVPGKWFREFSRGLGSERDWLKFSYVWFATPGYPGPRPDPKDKLIISDPLRRGQEGEADVLICEPETPGRTRLPKSARLFRGDVIRSR